ncbi:MAG: BREX-1 system adenine-specific DNA-methyltransferase PglX [Planctomycetia bacterium]|nr:BREX-1 system adenine-specific DNA-methyltransferase PglX [Planctomycetia bacterium]
MVEFLTDNTLGRIWYEMRKGDTRLKDQCRYMVRRPSEVFLSAGQQPSEEADERDDLTQEERLKLTDYISHRQKKDPRDLKILDPACGSGHFLLYCFALLLVIYEEAYDDPDLGPKLQGDYPTPEAYRQAVPGLILARNLHGIDIDPRAAQIAALALWLRAQRAYKAMGLKAERPAITRTNVVCAEPMPGEDHMLKEFAARIEPKLLGQLVQDVFGKMNLAGEAGSLLKIEEEIRGAVAEARRQWRSGPVATQMSLFDGQKPVERQQRFDLSGINDAQFFEQAESKVVQALRDYAENAGDGHRLKRRLFTEDAVRGFAFVDLCHQRFDVVLMNPPFGDASKPSKSYIEKAYPRTKNDLYAAFVECGLRRLLPDGFLGAITSRTGFFLTSFKRWREEILLNEARPTVFADLGYGVLDSAMVETAAYCLVKCS